MENRLMSSRQGEQLTEAGTSQRVFRVIQPKDDDAPAWVLEVGIERRHREEYVVSNMI